MKFQIQFFIPILLLVGSPFVKLAMASPASGWTALPGKLTKACPENNFKGYSYAFSSHCSAVVSAWNSAAFDSKRNRLLVWGGGHNDYYGNEMYSLDLTKGEFARITDPAPPISNACPEAIAGGAEPNSRHTYDGLVYMANVDRLFAVGGSLATCGYMSNATWTFDLASSKWQNMKPSGTGPRPVPGIAAAYDPNTGLVYVHDNKHLFSYDFKANKYTVLSAESEVDYHMTATIDPKRKKFVMVGGKQQWVYDLVAGGFKKQALGSSGAASIIASNSPGLAYDIVEDRIVAWSGGTKAYALDLDKKQWAEVNFAGGPGNAMEAGTNGRWDYVQSLNAFVLVNDAKHAPYLFKWSQKTAAIRIDKIAKQQGSLGHQFMLNKHQQHNFDPSLSFWNLGGRNFNKSMKKNNFDILFVQHP